MDTKTRNILERYGFNPDNVPMPLTDAGVQRDLLARRHGDEYLNSDRRKSYLEIMTERATSLRKRNLVLAHKRAVRRHDFDAAAMIRKQIATGVYPELKRVSRYKNAEKSRGISM